MSSKKSKRKTVSDTSTTSGLPTKESSPQDNAAFEKVVVDLDHFYGNTSSTFRRKRVT